MTNTDIYTVIGSALTAQNDRMSAIASNLANVDSIAPPGTKPYQAHEVVFSANDAASNDGGDGAQTNIGVSVVGTVLSNAPAKRQYDPGNPYADANGYISGSNVSQVGQMIDLIDSTNSYSASIAVLQQASRVNQQILSSFQVS